MRAYLTAYEPVMAGIYDGHAINGKDDVAYVEARLLSLSLVSLHSIAQTVSFHFRRMLTSAAGLLGKTC